MQKINLGRVILGGLFAGLIMNIWEFILNGPILGPSWAAWGQSLSGANFPSTGVASTLWIIWTFMAGLGCVAVYAGIRPRYGAGAMTAVKAGLLGWWFGWAMAAVAQVNFALPRGLILANLLVGLVLVPPSTVAGAWLYKEESQPGTLGAGVGR